ncbi:MAG: SagB/ThcOx family dehydrogenase [Deltaproteobacteria bacterium]|nr:SagB/ThcOx family dehydrogenase [Deltaproteobacteria bacterium]
MDWATQPDPFRRYADAPLVHLPLPRTGPLPFWQLYVPDLIAPEPLSLETVSQFFRYALSLTAWKQAGDTKWPLRVNPSSGNLHPTEGYAVLPAIEGMHDRAAVYHYAPKEHGLERRAELDPTWSLPAGSFVVGLTSILWREAWKYGERAFRYCQHDVGHALGTLRFAAAALGWKLRLLDGITITPLLGLDRDADFTGAEHEHPDLLALVSPSRDQTPLPVPSVSRWHGTANQLSSDHVAWPVIDDVAAATTSPAAAIDEDFASFPSEAELFASPIRVGARSADAVILERRSAVSMDRRTALSATTFFQMLGRLVPTRDRQAMPWDAIPWRPRIHLALFVHRVTGLAPGLYALVRDPEQLEPLRTAMRCDFLWQRPPACPGGLQLYLLQEGDCRAMAASVSCGQDIAGDGAFSLGMIADYMGSLARHGAGFYRNLFWEAGLVGQALYLEAEAAGIRATGIGCYFDDQVHEVLGIDTRDWQSLYHFTVGGPVDDTRLMTLPAYERETA